jgi:5-methylcytosine-specific restriction enzyme subunit McrC
VRLRPMLSFESNRLQPVRIINCEEYGAIQIPFRDLLGPTGTLRLNPEVEKGDFFNVSMSRGRLTLSARNYVGYIPLNENVVVYVRPRVPVANLTAVAELAGMPHVMFSSLRDYSLAATWSDSFLDVYASALADHLEYIVISGLLREYRRDEEVTSFPSGRVMLSQTLRASAAHGRKYRAHITRYARTADNAPNRCLKYAMWLVAHHYANRAQWTREARIVNRRLNTAYTFFDGVGLDPTQAFLADPVVAGRRDVPALRAYYSDALDVARVIIRQQGLRLEGGDVAGVRLPSLAVNMSRLFEEYVRRALQLYAADSAWAWQVLDGNGLGSKPLYKDRMSPRANPDIVITRPESRPLVLEIKYRPVTDISPRDDTNQAVTYAACYDTNRVVIIYPCDTGQLAGLRKIGDIGHVAVYQYRIDLGSADLGLEAAGFGTAVASLLYEQ